VIDEATITSSLPVLKGAPTEVAFAIKVGKKDDIGERLAVHGLCTLMVELSHLAFT